MIVSDILILEGSWWQKTEAPKMLPFFQALASTQSGIRLSHKSFRSAADIGYWLSGLRKGGEAFVCITSHGEAGELAPVSGDDARITVDDLEKVLPMGKGAIGFLHFSSCLMFAGANRRAIHERLAEASGARFVSGYSRSVPWMKSTLFDLTLIDELFIDHHKQLKRAKRSGKLLASPKLKSRTARFFKANDSLIRHLCFSAYSKNMAGDSTLYPERLRQDVRRSSKAA
jgi:hypothetical protein